MGKCLSCCPATQSVVTQTCDEKFTDITRSSEVTEQQPGMSGGNVRRCENGRLEPHAMTNSTTESNSNCKNLSLTEKLIFPILSTTCIENKRSSHSNRECSESKILALFEQYKDPNENAVLAEGIERLCSDLNVQPEDYRVLLLAWKFNAKVMFCFTKEEFVSGCRNLRADSVQDIQARFPEMMAEVRCPEKFKDFYRFTFKFGLDPDQRVLLSEMAIQLWKIVFHDNEPPILQRWLRFLDKHPSVRGISRDTWNMFLNFSESVGDDLSSYDDTAAWPSLFDDFVEYENDQTNQNVVPSKEKGILDT
ncbi:DCN1-like protein 3 [Uloborus diversus]|uniref:DCN1-like protein 3 n=1 Tax=Uloborus diversus TaxID=327109 RepID=UPI002409AD25|nr:DCN1-like protein 3 [Uloborus diversus]XP_054714928.1 DCN1-like protein 3 [Uloborus diversus]